MTVRILTDSTCDLPTRIVSALGIRVLPIYIHIGDLDYLDGVDISREDFYQRLPALAERIKTAVPSSLKFTALYDSLADEGADEVLSIHISSKLSAIIDMARNAARETKSVTVTVFDSRQLSLGTGFLVQTAAELAQKGFSIAEILPVLENQLKRTHVWAMLDTLQYLRRSGRMNSVISNIGDLLQIKPILKMFDGVYGVERVRTRKSAIARLVQTLQSYSPFEKLAFLHSDAIKQARDLQERVRGLPINGETWLEVLNPILGAHLGPGVVGFACVSR
jgi:DegV family protein with EDD domain